MTERPFRYPPLPVEWHDLRADLYWMLCKNRPAAARATCYIAGPMRGIKEFNYPVFNWFTAVIRRAGWKVHNPAENDNAVLDEINELEENANPLKVYMRQDLLDVLTSDCVFVLPGWEQSKGACLEVHVAHETDTPVYDIVTMKQIKKPLLGLYDFISTNVWKEDLLTKEDLDVMKEDSEDQFSTCWSTTNFPSAPSRENALDFGPEERATDPVTGGSKGRKQAVFANISTYAQVMKARVHGFGIFKYPDEGGAPNWTKGTPWSWMYDAAQRHILSFWAGETINPESGLPHLAHAAWMLDALMEFEYKGLGTDDRPRW